MVTTYLQCPHCRAKVQSQIPTHHTALRLIINKAITIPQLTPIKNLLKQNKTITQTKDALYNEVTLYTYQDLFKDTLQFAKQLSKQKIDCIIGIPRNGLIVASIIASYLGAPLSTPDDFKQGIVWQSRSVEAEPIKTVLVIDEIVSSGRNMQEAVNKVSDNNLQVLKATLLIKASSTAKVDYFFKAISEKACEWEIKHEGKLKCQ